MKIGLVSLITKEIEDFNMSISNKEFYCKKHNYTFINYNERQSKRHAPWDKIKCLLKTITWFDYIIWMDADALFNDMEIKFEDIINEHPEKELFVCKDPCYFSDPIGLMLNTGVMIFKNSEKSIELLNDVWNSCYDYEVETLDKYSYEGYPHEQGALINILKQDKYKNMYYLYEQQKFNCHQNCGNENTFILHYMGSRQSDNHRKTFIENALRINSKFEINNTSFYFTPIKKSKIAIVTMYTDNIEAHAKISTQNKKWYCNKYDIDLIVQRERLSKRHPAWDKIQCVLKAMEKSEYEYFIWMDADAIFLTDKIDFRDLLNIFPDKNFIVCNDPLCGGNNKLTPTKNYSILENLRIINTGIFIVKNNEEMKLMLQNCWETKSETNSGKFNSNKEVNIQSVLWDWSDWPYEQGAFHLNLCKRNDYHICPEKSFNTLPGHAHSKTFIQHNMGDRSESVRLTKTFKEINEKLNIPDL